MKRNLAGRELPAAFSGSNNGYFLHDVSRPNTPPRGPIWFTATRDFHSGEGRGEPARVLRMIFRDREEAAKELTVMTPTIGRRTTVQEAILWWIVYLYLFLLLTILLINILVLHRTLRPLCPAVARRLG